MVRLVDYVVIAGYAPHVKGGGEIIQRFPEQDWPDMPLPDGFEHFCMPHGWYTVRTSKPPVLHFGVLTDLSAERRYYACLVLFEPWREQHPANNRRSSPRGFDSYDSEGESVPNSERSRLDSHASVRERYSRQYVPTCIALLSRFRQYDLFRKCLLIMHATGTTSTNNAGLRGNDISVGDSVERIVAVLSSGVNVPYNEVRIFSTACLVKIFITQQRTLYMIQRAECALPSTLNDCYLLLRLLGVDNVIYLVCAALTDHKLLLLSSSYARLNACAHAIESLMYPLQYSHTFVPVLPLSMVDYLGAPTPYIMGVRCMSTSMELPELFDVIHVDLDACRVDVPENVKVPFLPEPVRSHLRNSLMLSGDPALFTDDLAFPDAADSLGAQHKSPSRRVHRTNSSANRLATRGGLGTAGRHTNLAEEYARDKEIRAVFLRAMAELLSGYRSFLSVVRIYHADQLLPEAPPMSSFTSSLPRHNSSDSILISAGGMHNDSYRAAIRSGENVIENGKNEKQKSKRKNDAVDEFAANESGADALALQQRFQARYPVITFRRYAFLGLRQLADNDFMRNLVQSEAFEQFISRYACPYRQLALFDHIYASIIDDIYREDQLLAEAGHEGVGIDEAYGQRLHNIRTTVDGLIANESVADGENSGREPRELANNGFRNNGVDDTDSVSGKSSGALSRNDAAAAAFRNHQNGDNHQRFPFRLDADLIVQYMDHYQNGSSSSAAAQPCYSVHLPPFAVCREIPHGALADAVSRVPEMFNKARRLEVLQKCVHSIFAGRLVESRKVLPAIQRMLAAPEARIALTQQLARVPPDLRCVDNDQFDLLVKLINTALQEESDTDDYGVAAAIVPLACEFYRKLNAGATQCLYTSLQQHSVWSSLTFWEHAFYADMQRQIRSLYTTLRSGSSRGGGVVIMADNDRSLPPHSRAAKRHGSSESLGSIGRKADGTVANENTANADEIIDDVAVHSLATLVENDCILPLTANEMQKLGIFGGGANNVYRNPDIIQLKNNQIQQHASKENDLVYSLAMLYGSRIMCMRIPLDIHSSTRKERAAAALRRHNSVKTDTTSSKRSFPHRFGFAVSSQRRVVHHRGSQNHQRRPYAASSSTTGDVHHLAVNGGGDHNNNNDSDTDNDDDADGSSSVGSGESGCFADDRETQRDIETAVIRFIGRFLEQICRTCRVGDEVVQKLNLYVAGMVRMHVESVDVVYQEVKTLKISRKAHVAEPLLLPSERMLNSRLAQIAAADDASGFGGSLNSGESLYHKYRELDRTGIHSYLLPDGRDEFSRNAFDTGHSFVRNTLCLLYPAEGALFVTTHRIIWTGMSCAAAASGAPDGEAFVITKSFPISALFKDKKIDSSYVKEADLFLQDCLQLRSNAYEMLRIGFDAAKASTSPTALSMDLLRKALAKLRYPATINDLPLFVELRARGVQFIGFSGGAGSGFCSTTLGGSLSGGSLLSGGKKKNQTLSAFKHTLRRTAVAAGLRSGGSGNISKHAGTTSGRGASNTSATMRPRLPSNDASKISLRSGAASSHRPQSVVNIYDDRSNNNNNSNEVKFQIDADADVQDDGNEYAIPDSPFRLYIAECARLGVLATAAMADQSESAPSANNYFRLSEVNNQYKLCSTYAALLTLPASVPDAALETLSKLFRKQRFPIVSWKHPTNDALLLRSGHYHGLKSVVQKLNNLKNTTATLGNYQSTVTTQYSASSASIATHTSPPPSSTHMQMMPMSTPIGGSSPLFAGGSGGGQQQQQQHRHQHADFEDFLAAVSKCVDECRRVRLQQSNAAAAAASSAALAVLQQQQPKNAVESGNVTPMSELSLMSDVCREIRFDYDSVGSPPPPRTDTGTNITMMLPSNDDEDVTLTNDNGNTLTTTRIVPSNQQSDTASVNSSLYAAPAPPVPPQRPLRARNVNYNTQPKQSASSLSTAATSHTSYNNKSFVHIFTDKSVARSMRAINPHFTFHATEFLDLTALKATYKKMMQKVVPSAVELDVDEMKTTTGGGGGGGGGGEPNSSSTTRNGATITPATAAAAVAAATSNNAGSIVAKPIGKGGEQTALLPFSRLHAVIHGVNTIHNWLSPLSNMLNAVALIVNILDDPPMRNAAGGGRSVLLALEDGADFTSQLSSLVQLCIDPYYRTLHGFRVLIEKEWLAAGHRFAHHNRLIGVAAEKYTFAPYFLQFLDAVHQLLRFYPAAFQFNQYYVKFLAYHHTSNRFNTFICDCEAQRASFGLLDFDGKVSVGGPAAVADNGNDAAVMFMSIWDYVAQVHSRTTLFYNFDYDEDDNSGAERSRRKRVLRPAVTTSQLTLWDYYYTTTAGLGSLYEIELLQNPMHDVLGSSSSSASADANRNQRGGANNNNGSNKPRSQLMNGYNYADSRMPMEIAELVDEVVQLRAASEHAIGAVASDSWFGVYREALASVRRRTSDGDAANDEYRQSNERLSSRKSRQLLSGRQKSITAVSLPTLRMPLQLSLRGSALLDAQYRESKLRDRVSLYCSSAVGGASSDAVSSLHKVPSNSSNATFAGIQSASGSSDAVDYQQHGGMPPPRSRVNSTVSRNFMKNDGSLLGLTSSVGVGSKTLMASPSSSTSTVQNSSRLQQSNTVSPASATFSMNSSRTSFGVSSHRFEKRIVMRSGGAQCGVCQNSLPQSTSQSAASQQRLFEAHECRDCGFLSHEHCIINILSGCSRQPPPPLPPHLNANTVPPSTVLLYDTTTNTLSTRKEPSPMHDHQPRSGGISCEGVLSKRTGVLKGWKERYFVLDVLKHELRYYDDMRSAKSDPTQPRSAISLQHVSAVVPLAGSGSDADHQSGSSLPYQNNTTSRGMNNASSSGSNTATTLSSMMKQQQWPKGSNEFCVFEIRMPKKSVVLCAPDARAAKLWVEQIQAVINST